MVYHKINTPVLQTMVITLDKHSVYEARRLYEQSYVYKNIILRREIYRMQPSSVVE